ncbi:NAD(P)-binding [Lecanosticta acicola]|uniref:NAD(P)-binding n=1 Tax=Lecanosticta acicola TaxID=111012 RepID=A0AAI9E6I8_9PEZI|nr:NAD(P)-binding [Lecanosticta acicola]
MTAPKTWAIIGASRGIGKEFVDQLLARGDQVIATVREPSLAQSSADWQGQERCSIYTCDMLSEQSIDDLAQQLLEDSTTRIDYLVLNAGVLKYPNRATEISYDDFTFHLQTNTIGPIICAQRLLKSNISIDTITFISSDSGSAQKFREMEDGFAAYAASKAALNQMLRHMAAELKRKGSRTTVIALHPGEVKTDMADVDLGWDVEGQMTPTESVSACIAVVESKTPEDSGTFWTWENERYPW